MTLLPRYWQHHVSLPTPAGELLPNNGSNALASQGCQCSQSQQQQNAPRVVPPTHALFQLISSLLDSPFAKQASPPRPAQRTRLDPVLPSSTRHPGQGLHRSSLVPCPKDAPSLPLWT